MYFLLKFNLFRPVHLRKLYENKIDLNFYFDTSLWLLRRFYEGFIKSFEAQQTSVKKYFKLILSLFLGSKWEGLSFNELMLKIIIKNEFLILAFLKSLSRNVAENTEKNLVTENWPNKCINNRSW